MRLTKSSRRAPPSPAIDCYIIYYINIQNVVNTHIFAPLGFNKFLIYPMRDISKISSILGICDIVAPSRTAFYIFAAVGVKYRDIFYSVKNSFCDSPVSLVSTGSSCRLGHLQPIFAPRKMPTHMATGEGISSLRMPIHPANKLEIRTFFGRVFARGSPLLGGEVQKKTGRERRLRPELSS